MTNCTVCLAGFEDAKKDEIKDLRTDE